MEGFEGELDDLRQSKIVGLVKFVTILVKPAGLVTRLGGLVTVNAVIPVGGVSLKKVSRKVRSCENDNTDLSNVS